MNCERIASFEIRNLLFTIHNYQGLLVIEIRNLTKRYHTLTALNQVSLTISEGEVLGLLGPNGAGKTTLLKLIAGLICQDAGDICPATKTWPLVGFKPERLLFPNHLRVRQYLDLVAGISDIPKADRRRVVGESLEQVGLLEAMNKRISACSKGMRQRLGLAQTLIGDPPILLLDEPSNGLDPDGQEEIHRIIRRLHAAGKTIVMSSHQLPEVTEVCTQIAVLNRGQIHYENSMAEALAVRARAKIRADRDLTPMRTQLEALHPEIAVDGDLIVLRNEALRLRRQIMTMILYANYDIVEVRQARATLAEIYAKAVH
ncbi:MAG: ABC transporter ATP-binding protein [Chloroflexi bacterium]|nr:ABC transporter ATP-binding protein [Chloroflexota bacterium]